MWVILISAVRGASIGQRMWQAQAERKHLPVITEIQRGDSEPMKTVKRLVLEMAAYSASARPTMDRVEEQLTLLNGNNITTYINNID